jgi:glycosyltransferase involved in cell wall biosynthesis
MSGHLAVIPVFNEATTIGALVARAACHGPVVVDDSSSDGTARPAAAAPRLSAWQPPRQGRGTARGLRRGALSRRRARADA